MLPELARLPPIRLALHGRKPESNSALISDAAWHAVRGGTDKRMHSKDYSGAVLFVMLCCVAALLISCRRRDDGPKLIEADGISYVACGGAVWLLDDSNFKDPGTWSYQVIFNDAQGIHHELKRVRILNITRLPRNAPACSTFHQQRDR